MLGSFWVQSSSKDEPPESLLSPSPFLRPWVACFLSVGAVEGLDGPPRRSSSKPISSANLTDLLPGAVSGLDPGRPGPIAADGV